MNFVGKSAEDLACQFLSEKGLVILDRNWRCGHLEIDIIAQGIEDPPIIHFVEVKGRNFPTPIEPQFQVNSFKQRHIISAANGYIKKNKISSEVAFDIVSICFKITSYEIIYIPNAFSPNW